MTAKSTGKPKTKPAPKTSQSKKKPAPAAAALRKSAERYRVVLNQAADAVFVHDSTGRILDVNQKACDSLGYTREELLSRSVGDIDPEGVQTGKAESWGAVLAGGTITFESRQVRKDGGVIPVEVSLGSVRLPQGPVVVAIVRDITARKRAEEDLREESRHSRALIETSLDPLVTISAAGTITDVNAATERITGVSRNRLIGSDFADYFTDPARARAGYRQAFEQGRVTDYPLALRHVSGAIAEVLYNATVYRDERGNVLSLAGC